MTGPQAQTLFTPEVKKVVLFQLNGTLLDTEATLRACLLEAVAEWTGRWASDPDRSERLWLRYKAAWAASELGTTRNVHARKSRENRLPPGSDAEQRIALCLREALMAERIPLPNMDAAVRHMVGRYRQLQQERALPQAGMPAAVQRLAAAGYKLAVVSSDSRERTAQRIRLLGLEPWFPPARRYCADATGARKPARRFYEAVLRDLRAKPREAVVIGASWRRDVAGATAAGIDAVWANFRRAEVPAKPAMRVLVPPGGPAEPFGASSAAQKGLPERTQSTHAKPAGRGHKPVPLPFTSESIRTRGKARGGYITVNNAADLSALFG
ncbi:hypothetical protein SY83_21130 [Paenibacillus swuensis]|uniref:Haloacid dehalogenase n=1 Tax=Paenibacillus swuensis TaxID=1178515 RepID=A0A172TMR8_9BACL|nr:HAD family hydrolase [Paenibacillus swuensis]ANE48365.1 hypothetical protein SY83_21130 [Paenibacillus swuensis]